MDVSNKLRIIYSDFQENIKSSYCELREEGQFCDVTLASEDLEIKAHRVILSASSLSLKNILLRHTHPNPLVYMTGVNSKTLASIVEFIYLGEVNICEDNLNDFINLADELQVKGMSGKLFEQTKTEDIVTKYGKEESPVNHGQNIENPHPGEREYKDKTNNEQQLNEAIALKESTGPNHSPIEMENIFVAVKGTGKKLKMLPGRKLEKSKVSMPLTAISNEAMEKINEIIEKRKSLSGPTIWTCTICDFVSRRNKVCEVKEHAERHIEGFERSCKVCGETKKSSSLLRSHFIKMHNARAQNYESSSY